MPAFPTTLSTDGYPTESGVEVVVFKSPSQQMSYFIVDFRGADPPILKIVRNLLVSYPAHGPVGPLVEQALATLR